MALLAEPAAKVAGDLIDIPNAAKTNPKRSMSLDEVISMREVHQPQLSPDGQQVAYVVKQTFRSCGCDRAALYIANTDRRGVGRKLLEESSIQAIRWSPDGRHISYLSAASGTVQLWRIDPGTGTRTQVFEHAPTSAFSRQFQAGDAPATGILDYDWSHDGSMILFTAISTLDVEKNKELADKGFVYDDMNMFQPELGQLRDWNIANRRAQLWVYRLRDGVEEMLWEGPPMGIFARMSALSWSKNDKQIAFAYFPPEAAASGDTLFTAETEIAVVDVDTKKLEVLARMRDEVRNLAWSSGQTMLAVLSRSIIGMASLNLLDLRSRQVTNLSENLAPSWNSLLVWGGEDRRLYFESGGVGQHREALGIYALDVNTKSVLRVTPASFRASECSLPVQMKLSCVWQSPTVPPSPAVIELNSGKADTLSNINPELENIEPLNIREMYWRNEFGDETSGYLVLPAKSEVSSHRPLVIMAYGFDGEYVAQANENLTSYPAREFAQRGFAVLLFNYPRFQDWTGRSFEKGSRAFGYGPLSSLGTVIRQLASEGVVDDARVGFLGHSLGGFWVEFAITQSRLFQAVEIHEGGTNAEPGTYWFPGNKRYREFQEHTMGGPPYGESLRAYERYSPTLNADKARSPVLMEFNTVSSIHAMEMFSALRQARVPVEMVVYPGDGHIYSQPEHRYYSMQRNLDWFEFWLRDKEDGDLSKAEQYAQWHKLRDQRDAIARGKPN